MKYELDVPAGLRNTRVEYTNMSSCDPEGGLNYFGYPIEYLTKMCEFEEVSYLLQYGKLPNVKELQEYRTKIMDAANITEDLKNYLKIQPKEFSIQEILSITLNYLRINNPENKDFSNKVDITTKTIGILPSVVAYWKNLTENNIEIDFNSSQKSLAGLFLEKFNGKSPSNEEIKCFNFLLISYVEHELNASTYTAIITASSKSDYYSCINGALGTFWGPIHGGACEVVMRQLDEFLKIDNIEAFIHNMLDCHEKIYGFGHGAYGKNGDPRTPIIRELTRKLTKENKEFKTIKKIDEIMKKERPQLPANVDLYSSILIKYLGIKPEYCTAVLVLARICGWSAHVDEKRKEGTLIRPRAKFIGQMQPLNSLLENIKQNYEKTGLTAFEVKELEDTLIEKYARIDN